MKPEIERQIAETNIEEVMSLIPANCDIKPYPYQCAVYRLTGEAIRKYDGPFYINASVSAGKSLMISMITLRFQQLGMKGMVLSRQAEIIVQDADQMWEVGVRNSIYSASAGMKSTAYPIICGTEGTIANAMNTSLADFVPDFIIIDENHMLSTEDIVSELPSTQYSTIILEMQRRCKAKNNRDIRVIGYTGSPFRGTTPILGEFWKKQICDISTDYLVGLGFIVPTIFGFPSSETMYDLHEFHSSATDGVADFSADELRKMQDEILKQGTKTQKIMLEVMEIAKSRNGVMITCSGVKHCHEAAKYLPEGSYAIITESTGAKKRKQILDDAYHGRVKYLLQVGCLVTGINLPLIDTSVILRKIMSLTLLVQLLGRGMRKLKKEHIAAGFVKDDHLTMDYTDTMSELGELYSNPILEAAQLAKAKEKKDTKPCPKCNAENASTARRCVGTVRVGGFNVARYSPDWDWNQIPRTQTLLQPIEEERCEYFFSSKVCEDRFIDGPGQINGCGAENDPCARQCRKCVQQIYDPNANLSNRPYTDNDYVDVHNFNVRMTSNGEGVLYEYGIHLDGKPYVAREVFWPAGDNPGTKNAWKMKGIFPHVKDPKAKSQLLKCRNAASVMAVKHAIESPKRITHRLNDKNRDIINRKQFDDQ